MRIKLASQPTWQELALLFARIGFVSGTLFRRVFGCTAAFHALLEVVGDVHLGGDVDEGGEGAVVEYDIDVLESQCPAEHTEPGASFLQSLKGDQEAAGLQDAATLVDERVFGKVVPGPPPLPVFRYEDNNGENRGSEGVGEDAEDKERRTMASSHQEDQIQAYWTCATSMASSGTSGSCGCWGCCGCSSVLIQTSVGDKGYLVCGRGKVGEGLRRSSRTSNCGAGCSIMWGGIPMEQRTGMDKRSEEAGGVSGEGF